MPTKKPTLTVSDLARMGGHARAASMTPEQRRKAARDAGRLGGRPRSCDCGKCETCKMREYQRKWRLRNKSDSSGEGREK